MGNEQDPEFVTSWNTHEHPGNSLFKPCQIPNQLDRHSQNGIQPATGIRRANPGESRSSLVGTNLTTKYLIARVCIHVRQKQRELATFLEQEQAKAKMQSSIHDLTDRCWNTCITGSIGSKFSRGEASCLENCVDRFLDSSLFIVKQIEQQKGGMH
ncbi:hypothetical protein FFLO_01967 [Filobasidium floriforme]|uniref:Tim10-like domain-containing protein n=1 Tax=Filobasidium floriforme TaxID=5210 RepID=A0A8K0NS72_9TREE|nr:hypothetical protein FFLO_01967 [Filobasidium floriforme]